ncbi:MAG TPA: RNA polymerase sigma factor SigJ [Longimicrobiales bacterium]|nr:RNA polymerase sigma factor SigJ [Longimicrobiales bacterium]
MGPTRVSEWGGRAGEDDRLRRFQALRPRLFGIAYRMLQTRSDAEDVVQDAWRRLAGAGEVRSIDGFLVRTTTRLCLDREKSARARRERYVGPWLPELLDTRPGPGDRIERLESVNLALLHVLLRLGPVDRAVFLLREVFDYGYDEIADVVDRRPDACRQIARRARERVRREGADRPVDPGEHEALLRAFLEAARAGELARLEALLAEDVVMVSDGGGKVPSATREVTGISSVARLLAGVAGKAPAGVSMDIRSINGMPAAVVRVEDALEVVFLLQIADGRIRRIFAVRNPDKLVDIDVD